MTKRTAYFLMTILLPAVCGTVLGAGASWVAQGPFGGPANSVSVDAASHAVYCGTFFNGVMKSSDRGVHWAPANGGLAENGEKTVQTVAASPSAGGRLILGSQNGIWISVDGAASWSPTNVVKEPGAFRGPDIRAVTFAASDPTRAYAAEDGGRVWRSTDSGAHWTSSSAGITDPSLVAVAVDPTAPDVVYTSTFTGHVFRSSDGGKTFVESDGGMPHTDIDALIVDPTQTATIVAGSGAGIFRSTDHGATWHPAAGGPPGNGGPLDETPYGLTAASFGNVPTLYAACRFGGVFASIDHGATWSRVDQDLTSPGPYALAFDASAGLAYAALEGDFARSLDGGVTWSISDDGFAAQEVYTLAFDPRSSATVLAGTYGFGVFRSTDSGATWSRTSEPAYVLGLFFDRHDPRIVYFVGGNFAGVFRSANGGVSWTAINAGLASSQYQALAQSGSGSVLLTGNFDGEIFRSTNGGASWQKSVAGLTASSIHFLAADPRAAGTFFASTDSSIFRSTDGGVHWARTATGYPAGGPTEILVDPSNSTTVLAGSPAGFEEPGKGAWRSLTGGLTWNPIGGPLANETVEAFAADPDHPGVFYAGTFGGGVFRSADHGATWAAFPSGGLANRNVVSLAVGGHGWALQAGTKAQGSFRFDFPGRHAIPAPGGAGAVKVEPRT